MTWHFIGQLQANKTRAIAEQFAWVHTVDRERTARRLSEQRPHYAQPLQVLLQVRLDAAPHKGGVTVDELPALAAAVAALPRLQLRGLMCLPEPSADPEAQRAAVPAPARAGRRAQRTRSSGSIRCRWA